MAARKNWVIEASRIGVTMNLRQIVAKLSITLGFTIMWVLILPALWLVDMLSGEINDDAIARTYLVTGAVLLPAVIVAGLICDGLKHVFPAWFATEDAADVSPTHRVSDRASDSDDEG